MPLRSRILLTLTVVVALYAGVAYGVQRWILRPSFEQLEREQASSNLARATRAIEKDVESLDSFCLDWAAWDDTFEFVNDRGEEYIQANLERSTFENGNFDLLYVFNLQGDVVWGEVRDPGADWAKVELEEFPDQRWPLASPLLAGRKPDEPVRGLMLTSKAPLLVSSRPIVNSLKTEPMRGWLVMGRFLSQPHVAQLIEQTRVDFDIWALGHDRLSAAESTAFEKLQTEKLTEWQVPVSTELMSVYGALDDIGGQPALLLRANQSRSLMMRGDRALQFALQSTLAAAVLLLVVLFVLLQRGVLRPLADLTRHAVKVGSSDDLSERIATGRADELGILARAFDSMVERLDASRAAHLEAARLGGRSEVASAVLHNIGNVLNSVNISAEMIRRRLDDGGLADIGRLSETLQAHREDMAKFLLEDERGRHLPSYLLAYGHSICSARSDVADELSSLMTGIEHVKALIEAQQCHAGGSGALERVSLIQQVEAALKLARKGDESSAIEVVRDFEQVPDVILNRHRLLEVLVNLLRNALQSLKISDSEPKRLNLRINRAGSARVRIEITDNGVGIEHDDLPRVFGQRYTRWKGGQGLGLHAAANAASEMGGSLRAHSGGPGTGATFILEVSLAQGERAA